MPSPTCQVNSSSTTNGVNVTASSTVTIALQSLVGVTSWSISCFGTDARHDYNAINASLVVNQSAKTATFTAPNNSDGYGVALGFISTINNGIDSNNVFQPSYSTTFGVFILNNKSFRTVFAGQTLESNATFGWSADVDTMINTSVTLTGAAGGDLTGLYPNPTIGNSNVTNAKLANMTTDTFKGNVSGSTAAPSDVALSTLAGSGLSFASHTLATSKAAQLDLDTGTDAVKTLTSNLLGFRPGVVNNTSNLTVTNSTGNNLSTTYTIPANTLTAGSSYLIYGYLTLTRVASASICNLTVSVLFNGAPGSEIPAFPTFTTLQTRGGGLLLGIFTCQTGGGGGSGIMRLSGISNWGASGAVINDLFTSGGTVTTPQPFGVNTTITNTLNLNAVMSAGVAGLSTTWTNCGVLRLS